MGLTTKEIGSSSFNDMISSVDRRSEYVENRAGANVTLNNFLTPYTLDNKSSILNAPCGYSNGMYASLRPVQTIGPELVTNGDFSNGTNNWTLDDASNGSISVVDGKLEIVSNGGAGYPVVKQGILTSIGKKYSVTFSVTNNTTGFWFRVSQFESHLSGDTTFYANDKTSSINFKGEFTAISTTSYLKIFAEQNDAGSFQIDNVSVKEVTDADFDFTRGSSATRVNEKGLIEDVQILSGELVQNGDFEQIGSELVTNGNFDTDSDWIKGTGTTISDGNANFVNATGVSLYQNIGTQTGTVKVEFTVTNYTSGTLNVYSGGNQSVGVVNVSANALGTYTANVIRTGGNVNIIFGSSDSFTGSIDNVSVKEVGQDWTVTNDDANNYVEFNQDEGTVRLKFLNTSPITTLTSDTQYSSGKKYKLTVDVKEVVSGAIKIDAAGVSQTYNSVGVQEAIIKPTGNANISFYRATANVDITLNSVSLIEITDDTDIPRIDYTSGQGALLLEPQSTNKVTQSETFSSPWGPINATIESVNLSAPDGSTSVIKMSSSNTSNGEHKVRFSVGTNPATSSIFAKMGEVRYIMNRRNVPGSGWQSVVFDLQEGVVAANNYSSDAYPKITHYGNGWYRCEVYYSNVDHTETGWGLSNGTDQNFTPTNTTDGLYIWGAQQEDLSYATSYIPTEASTVTRSADVANNSGNANLINSTEGVLYAEIAALANSGNKRRISLSDGTDSNGVILSLPEPDDRIKILIRSGGAVQVNSQSTVVITPTDFNKIAIKYKENDFALWVNGTEVFVDSSGLAPIGLNKLAFDFAGSNNFYGNVKALAVFKEALTDAELAQITSATQQEVFYEMRDRMLQINADYYEFGDYTTRLKKLF